MKNICLHKSTLFIILLFTGQLCLHAQVCTVDMEQLKGTYTGECKKGKAQGEGKAVGTDTYEGQFKSGLPDGKGIYTWGNGNIYKGEFQKGLKNGDGVMTYRLAGKQDSIVRGFWKKDVYIGLYEYAYKVFSKSRKITRVDIKPSTKKGEGDQITITVSSTMSSAGITGPAVNKVLINSVSLQTGSYARMAENTSNLIKTEIVLYDVSYPTSMRIDFVGGESTDVRINEKGNYRIDISINQ
jgi:hypothetical protein